MESFVYATTVDARSASVIVLLDEPRFCDATLSELTLDCRIFVWKAPIRPECPNSLIALSMTGSHPERL